MKESKILTILWISKGQERKCHQFKKIIQVS